MAAEDYFDLSPDEHYADRQSWGWMRKHASVQEAFLRASSGRWYLTGELACIFQDRQDTVRLSVKEDAKRKLPPRRSNPSGGTFDYLSELCW